MPVPCPVDADLVDRLVRRVARAEGKEPEVVRLSEGITARVFRCEHCGVSHEQQLAALECAQMDHAEQRSMR